MDINSIEKAVIESETISSNMVKAEYLLAFRFNDYLDMYRKREQKRVGLYVKETYDSKKGEFELKSYEIPLTDLIKNASGEIKKSGAFAAKTKLGKNVLENFKNNVVEDKISEEHVIEAKQAYNGVRNRVEQFYKKAGITGNDKKGGLLLQKIGRKQEGAKLSNYGSLAEGYFSYLLDDHVTNLTKLCQQPKGDAPYYSHPFIKNFYEDYLSGVTNLSAIVEEDVKDRNKEYAVKKEGADLPDLGQYKKIANQIISTDAPTDIEKELKAHLNKESKINPALTAKEIAEQEIQDFVKELKRDIGKGKIT